MVGDGVPVIPYNRQCYLWCVSMVSDEDSVREGRGKSKVVVLFYIRIFFKYGGKKMLSGVWLVRSLYLQCAQAGKHCILPICRHQQYQPCNSQGMLLKMCLNSLKHQLGLNLCAPQLKICNVLVCCLVITPQSTTLNS